MKKTGANFCNNSNTWLSAIISLAVGLTGCGVATSISGSNTLARVTGNVHGGQQPVSGAHVFLYAVSTSANAGTAASLLNAPGYVTTDAGGNFSITNDYQCPAGAYVYLLATGGNPGLAANTNNAQLALAAGLGACSSLTPTSFYTINEVTTVAAAYSLAAFATSETQIGSADIPGLSQAFANITNITDIVHGSALTTTPIGGGIVPREKIDSLANAIAACVNSDGTNAPCSTLMAAAGVSASNGTPVDTFQAALNIAHDPSANVSAIFDISTPNSAFQPTLSAAPSDWTINIQYPAPVVVGLSPSSSTVAQGGQQSFTASVNGATATSFSYQWTTTGALGVLNEAGGNGLTSHTSYCSTISQTTFVANASPVLTANATATVAVQIFSGAGCVAANALGTSSVLVAITPPVANLVLPGFPTTTATSTVVLPSGVTLTPDQLTIVSSLTQVTPSSSGTFALPTYPFGSQIVVVQTPDGNPMMLGWLDATHNTVSATSTAEVLAFYALGGPLMFSEADRNTLEAAILNSSYLPALAQAIATEMGKNPDYMAQQNVTVQSAINTLFTSVSGITPQLARSGVHTNGILVNPTGPQSGENVEQLPPFQADVTNSYRRRTHAFVQRISDTPAGTPTPADVPDPNDVTDFEVSPVTGLTGGVAGTISDIYNFYWGNTTAAYAPTTSDPFPVPLVTGYAKTTYKVTIVGPGKNNAVFATLTDAQAKVQLQVAVGGFVTDALIPFMSNFTFGSGFPPSSGSTSTTVEVEAFKASWKADLQADFLNALATTPGLQTQIMQGDYQGALASVIDSIRQGGVFRDVLITSVQQAAGKGWTSSSMTAALQLVNKYLNAAGGVLQIFDSSVYASQLSGSNAADQWTVVVSNQKVTLSPTTTNLSQFGLGFQLLTAAVPGADTTGFSYYWTNTGLAGDLTPVSGNGAASNAFCSSSSQVDYIARHAPTLTAATTDTITVKAYSGGNCVAANLLGTADAATVTVAPQGVTVTPANAFVSQTAQQTLVAAIPGNTSTSGYSYLWTTTTTAGTLNEVGGGGKTLQSSYCSSSNQATYVPNASPTLLQNASDTVTVQAFTAASCPPANSLGAPAQASITVTAATLLLTPRNTAISQTEQQTLLATVSGSTGSGFSYKWSTTGTAGILTGTGSTGQASYCSSSNQATYVPNSTPALSIPTTDAITVQAFSSSTCDATKAVSAPVSTTVTVTEPQTFLERVLSDLPGTGLADLIQARDGNFYGTTGSGGASNLGTVFKLTPGGVLTIIHSFSGGSDGQAPASGVIEGTDGNLYGTTTGVTSPNFGTIYKITPAGVLTTLHAMQGGADGIDPVGALVQGNDGNFYGTTEIGGDTGILNPSGVFYRITPSGAYSVLTIFTGNQFGAIADKAGTMIQGSDGDFYGTSLLGGPYNDNGTVFKVTASGSPTLLWAFTYNADGAGPNHPPLVEDANGYFYGATPVSFQSQGGGIVFQSSPGNIAQVHPFAGGTGAAGGFYPVSGLTLASDGNLYGVTYYGGIANCGVRQVGCGTFYRVSPSGDFTSIYAFGQSPDASLPYTSTPLQASDGNFYGLSTVGGSTNNGAAYVISGSPGLPAPVQLSFSANPVPAGQPVTLTWKALEAFSITAQQCVASVQGSPAGTGLWTGVQTGAMTGLIYGGTAVITPTTPGSYIYVLTCGGRRSGFTTLIVQ